MDCFSKVTPCLDVECEAPVCVEHRRTWEAYWEAELENELEDIRRSQFSWTRVGTCDPSDEKHVGCVECLPF
jgi:hypothetical protein